jgi:hypothetical protein
MASIITLGLSEIRVGTANAAGTMPGTLTKIGMTYQDTCKMAQAVPDVTEHYEEGKAAPAVRMKKKKMPVLTFSILDPDQQLLANYVGGSIGTGGDWGYDGSEAVANKAIKVVTKQGLDVSIPNADIQAVIDATFSDKGLFMVAFTVTPIVVTAGKPIYAGEKGTGTTTEAATTTT